MFPPYTHARPSLCAFLFRYAVKDEQRVWPVQQYRLASGRDAFHKGLLSLHEDQAKRTKGWIERKLAPTYDPAEEVSAPLCSFQASYPWLLECRD